MAAEWIADTQRERKQLERQLGQRVPNATSSSEQVKELVKALQDNMTVLGHAEPAGTSDLYDQFGISLAYDRDGTLLRYGNAIAEAGPVDHAAAGERERQSRSLLATR